MNDDNAINKSNSLLIPHIHALPTTGLKHALLFIHSLNNQSYTYNKVSSLPFAVKLSALTFLHLCQTVIQRSDLKSKKQITMCSSKGRGHTVNT